MKNALYVLRYTKRHLLGRSNIESEKTKWKNLAIVELCWFEGISQLVR